MVEWLLLGTRDMNHAASKPASRNVVNLLFAISQIYFFVQRAFFARLAQPRSFIHAALPLYPHQLPVAYIRDAICKRS